jgi:hypothetical protein
MFTSTRSAPGRDRRTRAKWLPLMAACLPLTAGADVIAVFDEVADLTVTPIGVTYTAVTPEEIRTVYANDMAAVHVAMYDAAVAVKGVYEPFYTIATLPSANASVNAAAATAACNVLRGLFPNRGPQYEATCESYLDSLPDGISKSRGIAIGEEVAAGTLAARANDGRSTAVSYMPGSEPGDFRGTNPALPFGPFIRPFALTSVSQFRAEGPPDLTSFTYAKDLNEVKALGSATSTVRNEAQTDLARFATEPPPRWWPRNMRQFAADGRSVLQHARTMAFLWVAQADVTNACFDSKYHYEFWRPFSAIQLADTDDNPATEADPAWAPIVPTPNHPEYPAAHACNAAAVGAVLQKVFGGNRLDFSLDSTAAGVVQTVRHYKKIDVMVNDLKVARIYGGMHYRNSVNDGATLGVRVANYIGRNHFRRMED